MASGFGLASPDVHRGCCAVSLLSFRIGAVSVLESIPSPFPRYLLLRLPSRRLRTQHTTEMDSCVALCLLSVREKWHGWGSCKKLSMAHVDGLLILQVREP